MSQNNEEAGQRRRNKMKYYDNHMTSHSRQQSETLEWSPGRETTVGWTTNLLATKRTETRATLPKMHFTPTSA